MLLRAYRPNPNEIGRNPNSLSKYIKLYINPLDTRKV